MFDIEEIKKKYTQISFYLDEKQRRLWAGNEANSLGYGGVKAVSVATGMSRNTIDKGIQELTGKLEISQDRVRKKGGGNKKISKKERYFTKTLKSLVESTTRGCPENTLIWTCKSTRKLSEAMKSKGYHASYETIRKALIELGYSLKSNRKKEEGNSHPNRNAQFEYINENVKAFQRCNYPVISVDTKKKELIGNFKNEGKEWLAKGENIDVNTYDFPSFSEGKAVPYGVYDISKNKGWVSVGISSDTAEFAVETIRKWWNKMGKKSYKKAKKLMITADSGGSNSARARLWKLELQKFANETGLEIWVSHFPPATSKWNKIEHRMFSYITQNWRGKPLCSYEMIVNLIANTTTKNGLKISCELDKTEYEKGKKVSDDDFEKIQLDKSIFFSEWNYIIKPNAQLIS